MNAPKELAIGSVARMAGITVRTLHHYHEVGLLKPSGRTEAGYRRYSATDLERLQGILLYRELRFSLDEINELMADDADRITHLRGSTRELAVGGISLWDRRIDESLRSSINRPEGDSMCVQAA